MSDTDWQKNASVLTRSVPKDLRATCDAKPLSERSLGDLYRNILFLRTVVSCDPGQGVDTYFLVDFQSRTTAEGFIDVFAPLVDEEGQPSAVESHGGVVPRIGHVVPMLEHQDGGPVHLLLHRRRPRGHPVE